MKSQAEERKRKKRRARSSKDGEDFLILSQREELDATYFAIVPTLSLCPCFFSGWRAGCSVFVFDAGQEGSFLTPRSGKECRAVIKWSGRG